MPRVVGYVTRVGATIAPTVATGDSTYLPFAAYGIQGQDLGAFDSAASAQAAVQQKAASGVFLNWRREDMAGAVEHYIGEAPV
jgi:hypothetical protein